MAASSQDPQVQSLAKGMELLRYLTEAEGPVTGIELARLTDMHQSSASRVLQTLTTLGYVQKTPGGFVPDYGLLGLSQAVTRFPLVTKLQRTIEVLADENPGFLVNLALLFRGDLTYLLRASAGQHAITSFGFPLHVSSAGLRILVDLPREEALDLLRESRRKRGWYGTEHVPPTEEGVLDWAVAHVQHDVLVLDKWHQDSSVSGAIPLESGEPHPTVIAIAGDSTSSPTDIAFMLHDARRRVEAVLATQKRGS